MDSDSPSDSGRRGMSKLFSRREPSSSPYLLPLPSPIPSTATSTPFASRSTSPLPAFYTLHSSSCPSDSDSESTTYHSSPHQSFRSWKQNKRPWWALSTARRKRHHGWRISRWFRRLQRRMFLYPLFSNQPSSVVFILILFSILAVAITLLIMYVLNPDKDPLPWRTYCSIPSLATPLEGSGSLDSLNVYPNVSNGQLLPIFPPPNFDSLPPAGVFVGIFSVDSAFERRQLVRTTWASHPRSRNGAGPGDNGLGTSRTIVRFILGLPRKNWERRVKLEMETYKDMIIMPIPENMNAGKTHTFFSWSAINAFVPPIFKPTVIPAPEFSYVNSTSRPPELAPHDPPLAWSDLNSGKPKPWVRPDFVIKVDDDSFIMLAELEARLRHELHQWPKKTKEHKSKHSTRQQTPDITMSGSKSSSSLWGTNWNYDPYAEALRSRLPQCDFDDPLIYWGYLVTNRLHTFMAGEIYALSWSLIEWVSRDETVRTMRRGKEDKQTSKWIRLHPRATEVRWISERCWVYDHPRSGTVYSHGFLFPSEVVRIRKKMLDGFEKVNIVGKSPLSVPVLSGSGLPAAWAYSTVSTFGTRYNPPLPDLSTIHSVESLVEGSHMSRLREGSPMTPEYAWRNREGRLARYEGKRVGGTVAVHFIKKNMWYLETALALLEGDDHSEAEKYERNRHLEMERERHNIPNRVRDALPNTGINDHVAAATYLKGAEEETSRHNFQETMQREF